VPNWRNQAHRGAWSIALIYALFGVLWILCSDWVAARIFTLPFLSHIQMLKGSLYVVITAVLVYVLVARHGAALARAHASEAASQERYRRIVETANEGIVAADAEHRVRVVNSRILQILGYSEDEVLGRLLSDFVAPGSRDAVAASLARRRSGAADRLEYELVRRDGSRVWVSVSAAALQDEHGAFTGSLGLITDITAARQAETARRESENMLTSVLAAAPLGIGLTRARVIEFANARLAEMTGYASAELVGMPARQLYVDDAEYERVGRVKYDQIAALGAGTVETRWRRKDGTHFDLLLSSARTNPDDVASPVVFTALDISERRKSAEELRLSESRFRTFFVASPIAISLYDSTGRITAANPAHLALFGLNDLRAAHDVGLFDPQVLPPAVRTTLAAGQPASFEMAADFEHPQRRGPFYAERTGRADLGVSITPITLYATAPQPGYLVQVQDLTVQKRLESQLRHAQKMEAVGQLAGGVAHDLNNILTAVYGSVEIVRRALEREPTTAQVHDGIEQIERSSQRAAALTRQLLTFSRGQVLRIESLSINHVVTEMRKMLDRLIREDIQIDFAPAESLWSVQADVGQIEQVVMNLVVNARDAMPDGGHVRIATANVTLDGPALAQHPRATAGPYVLLSLADTGHGMDAATMQRIFEPFFTTKPRGEGTGLGLATVHGIVQQAGGHVLVDSTPKQGTTFRIYWPATPEKAPVERAPAPPVQATPRGRETILVCEDDDAVRELTCRALQEHGYVVLAAENPRQALHHAAQHAGGVDLLLTDVVLPDMDGRQLAAELHKRQPNMRVLYVSGYTPNIIVRHGVLQEGMEFLQKPFRTNALLHRVREVLGSRAGAVV
jgi:two-component system, cell cycle sensor histidine kinase and response regulator CckA